MSARDTQRSHKLSREPGAPVTKEASAGAQSRCGQGLPGASRGRRKLRRSYDFKSSALQQATAGMEGGGKGVLAEGWDGWLNTAWTLICL